MKLLPAGLSWLNGEPRGHSEENILKTRRQIKERARLLKSHTLSFPCIPILSSTSHQLLLEHFLNKLLCTLILISMSVSGEPHLRHENFLRGYMSNRDILLSLGLSIYKSLVGHIPVWALVLWSSH